LKSSFYSCLDHEQLIPPNEFDVPFVCQVNPNLPASTPHSISCCTHDNCNDNSTDDRDYAKFLPPDKSPHGKGDKLSILFWGKTCSFVAVKTLPVIHHRDIILKTKLPTKHSRKFSEFIFSFVIVLSTKIEAIKFIVDRCLSTIYCRLAEEKNNCQRMCQMWETLIGFA
jgi:hypothetical protein